METVIGIGMVAATVLCLIAALIVRWQAKKITIVAALGSPLFCWIYYA